jgi:hypothetical protein
MMGGLGTAGLALASFLIPQLLHIEDGLEQAARSRAMNSRFPK